MNFVEKMIVVVAEIGLIILIKPPNPHLVFVLVCIWGFLLTEQLSAALGKLINCWKTRDAGQKIQDAINKNREIFSVIIRDCTIKGISITENELKVFIGFLSYFKQKNLTVEELFTENYYFEFVKAVHCNKKEGRVLVETVKKVKGVLNNFICKTEFQGCCLCVKWLDYTCKKEVDEYSDIYFELFDSEISFHDWIGGKIVCEYYQKVNDILNNG